MLSSNREQGMALLFVLLISAIMAVTMITTIHSYNYSMRMSSLIYNRTQVETKLVSSKAQVITELMGSQINVLGISGETDQPFADFSGGKADFLYETTVSVVDLSGLISVNPLNKTSLNRLLTMNSFPEREWLSFIDRYDDWQDKDNFTRIQGKELGDYERSSLPLNMPIQSIEELYYLLDGESKHIYYKIAPWLSIYEAEESVEANMPVQLRSLLFDTPLDSGIVADYLAPSLETDSNGGGYPSGRFLITISSKNESIPLKLKFKLIRGLGTYQPFYVIDETVL